MARGNRFSVLSVNEAGCWENNEPMLAGKYQKKKKKKKTRREKCEAGACKMCYALQLSGLECDHHVPRVQWHEPLPVIFNTSGAIPKCVVKKKQVAAVFDEAKRATMSSGRWTSWRSPASS